jgi:general secretion pathway protein H
MRARRDSGMTLIEISVSLAVLALMLAVAIPALSSVTRAQLRQKSGQLAGAIRSLYGAAAIGGHTCRLVLDLDANAYWSECAKTNVRLARDGERARGGARIASPEEGLRPRDAMSEEERTKLELLEKSAFSPSTDIPKTELGGSSGLTEEAAIHVAQGDDVYSLLVAPLTGRVRIVADRQDAPGQRR